MKKYSSLIICLFFAGNVIACSCANFNTTVQHIEASDYVALVKVIGIVPGETRESHKITVQELALYKGNTVKEITVWGGNRYLKNNYRTSCDIGIGMNEEWIVFGRRQNSTISIGYCTNNVQYADSAGFHNLLNGAGVKVLGSITGYFKKAYGEAPPVNGKHILYYPNGRIEYEAYYRKGVKEGVTRYYYPDGTLNGEENYRNGKLTSKQVSYYPDGAVQYRNSFLDGTRIDTSVFYSLASPGKYQLWMQHIYDRNGIMLNSKSYQLPISIPGYDTYYLVSERIYDPGTKLTKHYTYHQNGIVQNFYEQDQHGNYTGDEMTYDDKGKLIKSLRVQKGKPNEIIYIDTTHWPGYKKQ